MKESKRIVSGAGEYDIGLVGAHTARNYGGTATQLALFWLVKSMHVSVLRIERPLNADIKPFAKPALIKTEVYLEEEVAPLFQNKKQMAQLNDECKMFLIGSDQIFNNYLYNAFGRFITLDWVRHDKKKVAYACSFGFDYIFGTDWDRAVMAHDLKLFDFISVREQSGIALAKKELGISVDLCLDPVFVCDTAKFDELAEAAEPINAPAHYIGAYILDPNSPKQKIIEHLEYCKNIPSIIISDAEYEKGHTSSLWELPVLEEASLEQWLYMIKHCDIIVTDSYHGVLFSVLFRKNFIAVKNQKRGATRFESILGLLQLKDRLIDPEELLDVDKLNQLAEKHIDYIPVEEILAKEKVKSLQWLEKVLFTSDETKRAMDDYDIIERRADWIEASLNDKIRQLQVEQQNLSTKHCELEQHMQYADKELEKKYSDAMQALSAAGDRISELEKPLWIRIWNKMKMLTRGENH